ncbi:MAG: hypothetical protein ACOC4E_02270 [Patescibacteria group bacterium]
MKFAKKFRHKLTLCSIGLLAIMGIVSATPQVLAYDALEIEVEEDDDEITFALTHVVAGDEVEEEYEYDTANLDEAYDLLANATGLSVTDIKAAVVSEEVSTDEEELEAEATAAIDDAKEEIAEASAYIAALAEDDDNRSEYESWLVIAEGYLEKANAAFTDEDFLTAEEWAEKAEDKAELISDRDDDDKDGYGDKDRGHGNDPDKCDKDNPGKSPNCKSESSAKPEQAAKQKQGEDKFKDYGQTTDRAELQRQLQELLVLLIALLQQQMEME